MVADADIADSRFQQEKGDGGGNTVPSVGRNYGGIFLLPVGKLTLLSCLQPERHFKKRIVGVGIGI